MMTRFSLERSLELVVLGCLTWPVLGSCLSRSFWRAFPGIAWRLSALTVAYIFGVVILVLLAPLSVLRALAAIAIGLLILVHWYSGVNHGRVRKWPRGSLRPFPVDEWFNRNFFIDQHRRYGSPFKTSQFVRPMACIVGLPQGMDFLREHDASLSSPPLPSGRFIPGGLLRHMSPEKHAITKEAFRKAIVPAVFEPLESFMRETFRSEFTRMIEAGIGSNDEGVRPRRHIQRAVFEIWGRLFFDIEPGTPEFARLKALYMAIDFRNRARASDDEVKAAVADIEQLLRERTSVDVASMDAAPRSILAAMSANGRTPLDDPTVSGNLIYLMHFSWGDVSGLLQWIFRMLTEHHEWAERLRATDASVSLEEFDGMSLSTRVVMETLRLEQMEHLYRVANKTITHDDVVIPRGWLVRICVRESHRDPAVFESPETFDPDRFLGRSYQRREYAPFGAGLRRACLGEGLSLHVGRIFAEELAHGYRWRTVSDGPYEYGVGRHWRPSSDWRVMLTPAG